MIQSIVVAGLSLVLAGFAGWIVPAWGVGRLMRHPERLGRSVTNYRGRQVSAGLGLVWLVWVAAVSAVLAVVFAAAQLLMESGPPQAWADALGGAPLLLAGDALPLLVVAGAAFLGFVDDRFGDGSAKGFRGHLSAMRNGELTTGGLKMLGIGALALYAGLQPGFRAASYMDLSVLGLTVSAIAGWLLAASVIALCANFVNLTDLRPGRSLKTYAILATTGSAVGLWNLWESRVEIVASESTAILALWIAGTAACLLLLVLGPVFAVWRADLGERGMMGDSGANAMGSLAGFLLVWRSPLWLIGAFFVLLLLLNLASERVSFSRVIERVGPLAWIDGLGRLPADAPEAVEGPSCATVAGMEADGAGTEASPAGNDD